MNVILFSWYFLLFLEAKILMKALVMTSTKVYLVRWCLRFCVAWTATYVKRKNLPPNFKWSTLPTTSLIYYFNNQESGNTDWYLRLLLATNENLRQNGLIARKIRGYQSTKPKMDQPSQFWWYKTSIKYFKKKGFWPPRYLKYKSSQQDIVWGKSPKK